MNLFLRLLALSIMASFLNSHASVWLRVNQAGYAPERSKIAVVLSDTDIEGETYKLFNENGDLVIGALGKLAGGKKGQDYYVKQAYYYAIDFSAVQEEGTYTLELAGAQTQTVQIKKDPYSLFATQALMHLRAMRSGDSARFRGPSHLGDSAAIMHVVNGDWRQGKWKEASPKRTVDMKGGHYDAGDYIKFTLNEAYLAWHLLTAYQENLSIFLKVLSPSSLPDVLDESKHSLDYLAKTFPDEDTFVIQVGDGKDHNQGWRLPDKDKLEGKRPALCALSRVHMGSAAAALALGAQVFKDLDATASALYESKAKAIYARARRDDAQNSAYEMNDANPFYYDETHKDNMALAAAELYGLTQEQSYLDEAIEYAPPAAYEVSWGDWNSFANYRMAELGNEAAKTRLLQEARRYERSNEMDNVWNLTGGYIWASLHRWLGMANAYERAQRLDKASYPTAPFLGVLDYAFGRNNWGIAMVASEDLPYSIRNVYNTIYTLTKEFPTGALSEGPGERDEHDEMKQWFDNKWNSVETNESFEEFNTKVAVFYDNQYDFVTQESTIGGQGDLILTLALASAKDLSPKPDSVGSTPIKRKEEIAIPAGGASRGPASLFVNKANNLFFFTPSQFCKAESLSVFNSQGKHVTTLYKNSRSQFIWNTSHIASGAYQVRPSDGSPVLSVRK